MTDHKPLSEGEIATPEEAAQVQRALGALDGLADLWAMKNDINDQLCRMFGKSASPERVALLLKWTKQAYVEGAYEGRTSATEEIADLKDEIERLRATPKPLDGEAERLVKRLRTPSGIGEPSDHSAMEAAANFIERARSTQKEATKEEAEKFFAGVYVQGWDQHIGHDGAIAIQNALAKAGLRIVKTQSQD